MRTAHCLPTAGARSCRPGPTVPACGISDPGCVITLSWKGGTVEPRNIVIAVDAELHALERRVEKLREIRRLAVELEGARLPAAAAPPRKSDRRASPAL
jgi:hypothetical protein